MVDYTGLVKEQIKPLHDAYISGNITAMKFIEGSTGQDAYEKQEQGLEKQLPVGVSPEMYEFHLDAKRHNAYQALDTRKATIIDIYIFTDVSTYDHNLKTTAGVTSGQGVAKLIKSGMETLWMAVPENVRSKYVKEDVIKLKDRAAMILKARKENSPFRGHKHTLESRKKMSESQRARQRQQRLKHVIFDAKTSEDPL